MLNIGELISKGESRSVEFKKEMPKSLTNIMKTIIAFANDAGGDVFIGINDAGDVVGIKDEPISIEERISNAAHDSIAPIPSVIYRILNIEDEQIFNIKVFPGVQKPYYLKRDGIDNGVYVRIGSTNKKADLPMINELRRQNLNQTYDEIIYYQQTSESLSEDSINTFVNKYDPIDIKPIDVLIRDKYLIKTNGSCYPTVGTVMLFSDTLPPDFEYASIIISRYDGNSRGNLIATNIYDKGLIKAVHLVINELKNNLWTNVRIENIEREEEMEIPLSAIREAVINAICHRDYSMVGASTKIDLFDDRLEIISPGNLPMGINLHELGQGASEIRNKIITKAFQRMGYIEKLGTGISRMILACHEAGLPAPQFEEPGRYFKVTFQRKKIKKDNSFEKMLKDKIRKEKEVKATELAEFFNVHPNTVLNYLRNMINDRTVEKTGKGPNVRYRLKL